MFACLASSRTSLGRFAIWTQSCRILKVIERSCVIGRRCSRFQFTRFTTRDWSYHPSKRQNVYFSSATWTGIHIAYRFHRRQTQFKLQASGRFDSRSTRHLLADGENTKASLPDCASHCAKEVFTLTRTWFLVANWQGQMPARKRHSCAVTPTALVLTGGSLGT